MEDIYECWVCKAEWPCHLDADYCCGSNCGGEKNG